MGYNDDVIIIQVPVTCHLNMIMHGYNEIVLCARRY